MRITFVLPTYFPFPIGGYRIVYQHANALAQHGHRVTILFPRHHRRTGLSWPKQLKAWVWPLLIRAKHRPLVDWQEIHPAVRLRLVGIFSDNTVQDGDAVIATAWQTADPVAKLSAAKGRKFYLIQDYENWRGTGEADLDATFRLPLHVIAISKWLAALASAKGASQVDHVTNAIDHRLFRVFGTQPTEREPAVIALYHIDDRKDTALAIRTLAALHARHPAIPITMFGTMTKPTDLPAWIAYRERPIGEELAALYNAHSIYLGSSRQEGWALPPAEAMACGCAFVGTDSGGPRDYAEDGETALLSPPGEDAPLIANLLRVVEDDGLRHRLQSAGRARIAAFTWKRAGDQMEDLLARGLG